MCVCVCVCLCVCVCARAFSHACVFAGTDHWLQRPETTLNLRAHARECVSVWVEFDANHITHKLSRALTRTPSQVRLHRQAMRPHKRRILFARGNTVSGCDEARLMVFGLAGFSDNILQNCQTESD